MRTLFASVIAATALTACETPPKQLNVERSKVSSQSFDATWQNLVTGIAAANLPIKTIAKDSGLIVLEQSGFNMADADCGKPGVAVVLGRRANVNIQVQREPTVRVTVNARFVQGRRVLDGPTYVVECATTGNLEQFFLNMI